MLISQFGLEVMDFVNRRGIKFLNVGGITGVELPWHRWPRFFQCFSD